MIPFLKINKEAAKRMWISVIMEKYVPKFGRIFPWQSAAKFKYLDELEQRYQTLLECMKGETDEPNRETFVD